MIIRSAHPLNAEPPAAALAGAFETAPDDFYVRCHGDVPAIDPRAHVLEVDGLVRTKLRLTLDALRRFEPAAIEATLQCAGNRRADMQAAGPTTGDGWAAGAIGTARWTGVRLADILRAAGAAEGAGLHVHLDGADTVEAEGEGRFRFGVSVPMEKATAPEVIVATGMGGAPLTPRHGAPLRAVVPGFAGVRSTKWLRRITVAAAPSANHMQQRDYKRLPREMAADRIDWSRGEVIEALAITSAICAPAPGATVPAGTVVLRGYAVAGGRRIARVEVSADGGASWREADVVRDGGAWCWSLWEAGVELSPGAHDLVVRATDAAGDTQPADAATIWNCKGYGCNSWHRVPVRAAEREERAWRTGNDG